MWSAHFQNLASIGIHCTSGVNQFAGKTVRGSSACSTAQLSSGGRSGAKRTNPRNSARAATAATSSGGGTAAPRQ
eukprot:11472397-Alexandrium_andersonii.AAC.1